MRNFLLCCLVIFASFSLTAQLDPFKPHTPNAKDAARFEQRAVPNLAAHFEVNAPADLAKALLKAPTQENASNNNELLLTLPRPDGSSATFRLFRYQMITDELQAMYPDFVTAEGWDVDAPHRRVTLNWTIQGFSASVLGGEEGRWYVEPLYRGQTHLYQSFFTRNMPYSLAGHGCDFVPDQEIMDEITRFSPSPKSVGNCQLQEYDLALACTANYFNQIAGITTNDTPTSGNQATVVAEMITAINRVNQVFKQDLAIQLNIINLPVGGSVQLVYGGDTLADPYTDFSGSTMLDENQANIDAVIMTGNYDIGHVFSTGGGGIASLGSPCTSDRKAQGVTGLPNPVGDPFYIDFVAHEIGHQFGGNHTFNSTDLNCQTRSSTTAYEPGSGTTIQAYAGICGSAANVQFNSDPYYHAISIQEISAYMELGGGAACATVNPTPNTPPTVNAVGSSYKIPTNTPFVLDAVGMDSDGDGLTYCWEQFDLGAVVAGVPTGFETGSPLFRSFPPTVNTERYFPSLDKVVNGGGSAWEVLPKIARDMNFIVTIRDNGAAGYGCTVQDEVEVFVINTGSQYAVSSPNGGEGWLSGGTETVTWDVADTDDPTGINCTMVEILLSTDGGASFPTSLGTVPNNGSAIVTVPVATETDARIMVRCDGNIFYDVSDQNFSIEQTDFAITGINTSASNCSGGDPVTGFQVEVSALQGYVGTVNLSATGLPGGTTANITPAMVTFTAGGATSQTVDLSINNANSLASGAYNFDISATDGGTPKTVSLTLNIEGDFPLASPTEGLLIPTQNANGSWSLTINHGVASGATAYSLNIGGTNLGNIGNSPNTNQSFDITGPSPGETRVVFITTDNGLTTCVVNVTFGTFVPSGTTLSSPGSEIETCESRPTDENYIVTFNNGDLTGPVTLSDVSNIAGLTVGISNTTLNDGQSTLISLTGEENLAAGTYTISIEADDGAATETIDLTLEILEDQIPVNTPAEGEQVQIVDFIGGCTNNEGVIVQFNVAAYTGPGTASNYQVFVSGGGFSYGAVNVTPANDAQGVFCAQEGDVFTYFVRADLAEGGTVQSCDRTFIATFNPLPVEWLSFTAVAADKSAQLNWSVIQDDAHEGFTVERRSEGESEWQSIGYVARVGANAEATYRYTDISVLEGNTYYYRLRQEDVDGQTDYSVIRTVAFGRDGSDISIVPNPTTDFVTIFSGENAPEELTYLLYSPLGQAISEGKMVGGQAKANLSNLPSGVYQLVVTDGGVYRETRRVVKK